MIDDFSGKYEFLSNFFRYDTNCCAEVFFQAMKATCKEDVDWILECNKLNAYQAPREAKKRGHEIELRRDWDKLITLDEAKKLLRITPVEPLTTHNKQPLKLYAMYQVLSDKFASKVMTELLLSTEHETIIEGNWWHDVYWGICDGSGRSKRCEAGHYPRGENWLGRLLMEIRALKFEERKCQHAV